MSILTGLTVILSTMGIPQEVFGHPKNFAVFIVSAIVLLIALLFTIASKKIPANMRENTICFVFLFFYFIDFKHPSSLWGLGALYLLLLFVIIRSIKKAHYIVLLICCAYAALWLAGWGYLQYMEWIPSNSSYFVVTGPYHNSAILAAMVALLLGVIINAIISFYTSFKRKPWFLGSLCVVVLFCIPILILSAARAAYIALMTSVAYGLYFKIFIRRPRVKQLFGILTVLLMISMAIAALYVLKPESAKGRLLIWKVSYQMIQDKPLFGFGKGGFAANYLYYQAAYMKSLASPEDYGVISDVGCISIIITSEEEYAMFASAMYNTNEEKNIEGWLRDIWKECITNKIVGTPEESVGKLINFFNKSDAGLSVIFRTMSPENKGKHQNENWTPKNIDIFGNYINEDCN